MIYTPNKYYIPYFTYKELACKQTSKIVLADGFDEKLLELRTKFNKPMPVTSACRSREYNLKIGGVAKSFHIYDYPRYGFTGCCAVDVSIKASQNRNDLISLAWQMGWSIGVYKNFIHLDRRVDYTKLKQVVFRY